MIRWRSVRGVRFAVLEDVIFVELPGPRHDGGPRAADSAKPGSRAVVEGDKPARSRSRGARPPSHGGARPSRRDAMA